MDLKGFRSALAVIAGIGLLVSVAGGANVSFAHGRASPDIVYTMSNAPTGNSILAFERVGDGSLVTAGSHPTGGVGTGTGLGNQGALAIDSGHLFVVNAGSDDVSVFRLTRHGLRLTDRVSSGGERPVSIAAHRGLVYVLNAGSDSIAGFRLLRHGRLRALLGSEQALSGSGTDPAQILFSKDGDLLIVTEKATNSLVTFTVEHDGLAGGRTVIPSAGQTPFGFALGHGRQLFVSEAAGGAATASSVSSWRIARSGDLQLLDPTNPTLQTAACWVAISPDGRFAYVTNTGSNTISGFRIGARGQLSLLNADGVTATTGGAPIDLVFSDRGRLLHVLNSSSGSIGTFRVSRHGALEHLGDVEGLPAGTNGLIAR